MNYEKTIEEINYNDYTIIDIRDPYAFKRYHLPSSCNIPVYSLYKNIKNIPKDKPILFICDSGYKAKDVCLYFNYHHVLSYYLKGGLNSFNPPISYY